MKTNKRRASSGIRHTWARLRPDLLKATRRNRSNAPEDSPKSPGQGIAIGGSRWYQARTGIGKQIIMEILPAHTIIKAAGDGEVIFDGNGNFNLYSGPQISDQAIS